MVVYCSGFCIVAFVVMFSFVGQVIG